MPRYTAVLLKNGELFTAHFVSAPDIAAASEKTSRHARSHYPLIADRLVVQVRMVGSKRTLAEYPLQPPP